MDRRMEGWMERRMVRRMDCQMDRRMERWMDRQGVRRMDQWMDGWIIDEVQHGGGMKLLVPDSSFLTLYDSSLFPCSVCLLLVVTTFLSTPFYLFLSLSRSLLLSLSLSITSSLKCHKLLSSV